MAIRWLRNVRIDWKVSESRSRYVTPSYSKGFTLYPVSTPKETEYNNECTSPESGFVLWWQQVWGKIRVNRAQFGREWVNIASKGPCTIVQACVKGNNFEKRVFLWHPGKIQRQWQKQFQSTVLTKPVSEKFNSIYLPLSLFTGISRIQFWFEIAQCVIWH